MKASLAVLVALFACGSALAEPAKKPTTIYYHTDASRKPEVLVETNGAWAKQPRAMTAVAGKPGWWRALVRGGASSLVFRHADSGEWIHAQAEQNFVNAHGARELYVKDRRLTYAAPEHAKVEHLVAPQQHGPGRAITVILPPGYDAGARKTYPVLYMFDGQNLLDSKYHPGGWAAGEALSQSMLAGKMEPAIIVGIHAPASHAARLDEYSPYRDEAKGAGGDAGKLLDYMQHELIPFVDGRYRTRVGREGRAVAGSSMGGLTAAGAMAARPELFFGGLIYSPAVWFANHAVIADVQRSKAIAKHRIVLYQGSRGEGEGKDEGEKTEALYHALVNKGLVEGKSIFRIVDEHGQHTEAAWRKQLPYGLSLLFPPR